MPSTLVELRERLDVKRDRMNEIFQQAGDNYDLSKVTILEGGTGEKAAQIKALNDEMTDLGEQIDAIASTEDIAKQWRQRREEQAKQHAADGGKAIHPTGQAPAAGVKLDAGQVSIGEAFTGSKAFTGYSGGGVGPVASVRMNLKALFETTAGWEPEVTRAGRLVEYATRPIQVIDMFPVGETTQAAVKYMEETTFTNAGAETAEGGSYPEAALELTEKTSPVQKVAVFIPVTDEQVEDEPRVQSYLDNRLRFMLRQRLDSQVLVGNGTAPNLRGALNVSGIQTQAKGADPVPDAVYKAMTKIRVTGRAIPSGVIMHPNDWQDIRLLRTADGIYIWGSPSETGPERIWGLNVAQSDGITENTALVGDFAAFSELVMRRDIDFQVSNSHSDYFVKGKLAIRADLRAAVVFYRPAAFCTVTGI